MARARSDRADPLAVYRGKRRFDRTPEPQGNPGVGGGNLYTIQKHAARRLHFDLRLELDGVLLSWAVTKGPSVDPSEKRLAVRTEDHPIDYAAFEGRIPEGNYGAGTVLLWDRGTWHPLDDPHGGLEAGKLVFELNGDRLRGRWALIRFRGKEKAKRENWLLIKEQDEKVNRARDITERYDTSVASGRTMDEVAAAPEAVWRSDDASGPGKAKAPAVSSPEAKGRRDRALPEFVKPALATLVDDVPKGDGWLFEVKFDGYRAVASVSGDEARIHTRSGLDWTGRYPAIAQALRRLDLDGAVLDGEIVAIDQEGRSDFSTLHRVLEGGGASGLSYFVFDLLAEGGRSLTGKPLRQRKARLQKLLGVAGRKGPVFFTDHVEGDGAGMLATLCRSGYEGVIAKRADAPYRSGRGRSWLKVKCGRDQEFVIVGWSPSNAGRPFASLLLATGDDDGLRYAGRVGSGFSERDLAAIAGRLRKLDRKTPAVAGGVPPAVRREAQWVKPELVAQIAFAEFTSDGLVRQGRFLGLRDDKPARSVRRERATPVKEAATMPKRKTDSRDEAVIGGVRLTHPDRVLYPQQGVTKQELAAYLQRVSGRMLPHLSGRLMSLVRCPQGRARSCFFQRHGGSGLPDVFKRLPVRQKDGGEEHYLYIDEAEGLLNAAQIGVLELHLWGSRVDDIERPDRLVFDLDPDPTVGFDDVKRAATHLRDALDALGLQSFPLLTGGKGIHVVAPMVRRHEWPVVKAFAKALAERFAQDDPARYVATMSKAKRKGRLFIDYFRNNRGSTAIAPYSPRAREGAAVAWPVAWKQLDKIRSADAFRLRDVSASGPDPWPGYGELRQSLKAASLRALGVSTD